MGLTEGKYDDLLNFEFSDQYDERQKAALAYAEAITWHLDTDDDFWNRLYQNLVASSVSRSANRAGCASST